MQARSSSNSASYNNHSPQLLLKTRSFLPRSASPPTPSSPLAHNYSSRESNERRASHRKSSCELIPEELNLGSDLSATLHNHLDISSEPYKRHHKPRSPLIRSQTEPFYLSTTTTKPVHIPSSRYPHCSLIACSIRISTYISSTMATLAPRTDTLNARVRGGSHIDFKTATTGVAAKAMRNEISHLVSTCEEDAKKVRPIYNTRVCHSSSAPSHLTPKCNHSSTSLPAISQNAQKAWICT